MLISCYVVIVVMLYCCNVVIVIMMLVRCYVVVMLLLFRSSERVRNVIEGKIRNAGENGTSRELTLQTY